jgi:hypothetical protein
MKRFTNGPQKEGSSITCVKRRILLLKKALSLKISQNLSCKNYGKTFRRKNSGCYERQIKPKQQ